ncbi:putative E3 ubiquitin ligase [Handroanthus impetiginosus]|uniref:Putative E3 ubiquitin ligase n=1 Tax=Handroanthus impetiginosus TaxID=429701 RepID=A0A2G9HGI9_9LAMI|nr:putative E3 ubiquitin ligase [Handroanthus impetiginosus]PIN16667.1 putative E3 ubiquitin ligase [Handroanthus impetiginosus]
MMSEAQMMNNEVYNHYLSGMTPAEIAHLKEICPEFGDLNDEEVLLLQESAFLYIENNKQNSNMASGYGETSNRSSVSAHENESSHGGSTEHQLALDEAIARALELGDDFNNLCIHEHDGTTVDNTRSTIRETPSRVESQTIRQDTIDPDTMTYEQLQSLGESVGSESRGLSANLISRLPTFKHKAPLFSKKKKKENDECVICWAGYKNGAMLTTLPCAHQYHSKCINTWLRLNKQCPICQKEVEDE